MDLHYEPVVTTAKYAPWKTDKDFQEAYQLFKPYTLVEETRCWELWDLLGQRREVSMPAGMAAHVIEVGVWRGGTGGLLAWRARQLGLNCKVYLCDTWSGVPKEKITSNDPVYRGGEHADAPLADLKALITQHNLTNVEIVQGIFPDSFPKGDIWFRLAHIDVDVYRSASEATDFILFNLVSRGIIVYDDYGFVNCGGVTRYVNELKDRGYTVIHNLNGHAVFVL